MSEENLDIIEFIQSMNDKQLNYIASSDYGDSQDQYFRMLKQVIVHQSCILYPEQQYMPGEVIRLCSNSHEPKHAKEFVSCNLLLIVNRGAFDNFDLAYHLKSQENNYSNLSESLQVLINRAYKWAGF